MLVETTQQQVESKLATWMRGVGGAALALSAVVFMLQGIDDIGQTLRYWMVIGLIGTLAGLGVVCRMHLTDPKSARLCFAFAVAMLSVQVSQLSGMIHELGVHTPVSNLPGAFASLFAGVGGGETLWSGLVTLVLFVPVAFTAFSILARPQARQFTFVYALMNTLLVIPTRDGMGLFLVLGLMASLVLVACKPAKGIRTFEAKVADAVLVLPFSIALVRAVFHIDGAAGWFALMGMTAAVAFASLHLIVRVSGTQALLKLAASLTAALSWIGFSICALPTTSELLGLVLALAPAALMLLLTGRLNEQLGRTQRLFAGVTIAVLVYLMLLTDSGVITAIQALIPGVALVVWSLWKQERESLCFGVLATLYAVAVLLVRIGFNIEVNTWLALGGLGLLLVLGASLAEKYARVSLQRLSQGWHTIAQWR